MMYRNKGISAKIRTLCRFFVWEISAHITSSITEQGAQTTITRLTLYDCDIDELLHIAEALQVNLSLSKIHLSFVDLLLKNKMA